MQGSNIWTEMSATSSLELKGWVLESENLFGHTPSVMMAEVPEMKSFPALLTVPDWPPQSGPHLGSSGWSWESAFCFRCRIGVGSRRDRLPHLGRDPSCEFLQQPAGGAHSHKTLKPETLGKQPNFLLEKQLLDVNELSYNKAKGYLFGAEMKNPWQGILRKCLAATASKPRLLPQQACKHSAHTCFSRLGLLSCTVWGPASLVPGVAITMLVSWAMGNVLAMVAVCPLTTRTGWMEFWDVGRVVGVNLVSMTGLWISWGAASMGGGAGAIGMLFWATGLGRTYERENNTVLLEVAKSCTFLSRLVPDMAHDGLLSLNI